MCLYECMYNIARAPLCNIFTYYTHRILTLVQVLYIYIHTYIYIYTHFINIYIYIYIYIISGAARHVRARVRGPRDGHGASDQGDRQLGLYK